MEQTHLVAIGASAGGVTAVLDLAARLPARFPAVVAVVIHIGAQPSILPELLNRSGPLPALHPSDGDVPEPGKIYVAPPDHHMLVRRDVIRLVRGPHENHARPAIDPLFRTGAIEWAERAIGVVLTGALDDGTAGLAAIKACGGVAIVQDPATAVEPGMPASALANVAVDHCLPMEGIAAVLERLVSKPVNASHEPAPEQVVREQAIFEGVNSMENLAAVAAPSILTCPECGGALLELNDKQPLRYRCHTGHAYTARTLELAQAEQADQSMWSTLRSLREREMLLRRVAAVIESTGDSGRAQAGRLEADRVRDQANSISALMGRGTDSA
jgi:two-component system, chemotaxis family, protein-glutamate methylesterase/glutaminase